MQFGCAVALAAAILLCACESKASNGSPKAVASPVTCSDPAVLVTYPRDKSWHGLRIGPLFFSAFGPGTDQAVIPDFDPRYPTKVVIQPIDPLDVPVKLEGRRCFNGERLRFEYGASWDMPVATLTPAGVADSGMPVGYTGYMLFTAPGKWMISVSSNVGTPLGSAVVMVQPKAKASTSGG
jgi:hypothetical protein